MHKRTTLLVLLISFSYINAFRVFDEKGSETILAMDREKIKIKCKTDMPMSYCGFVHPTGKRFSFSGASLDAGQCTYTIVASSNDSGVWRCHIGRKGIIGLEEMQIINLRVVGELAAVYKNISTVHGKQITIACATTKGMTPLKYCRFEPPNGKPFSINSDVTAASPILDRYYFPNNKSLDRGDCAVTISKVKYEDVGVWTCGAGLGDGGKEHIDTILLDVEGLYTMSRASATGITFGAIGIVTFLGILAFVVWKKRRLLGSVHQDVEDEQEMSHLPTSRTPQASPYVSRQGSIHQDDVIEPERQGSIHQDVEIVPEISNLPVSRTPNVSRQGSRQASRQGSRQASPQRSSQGSPLIRRIPLVVVKSPSVPSEIPAPTRPELQEEQ